ncbi:hypothetical protein [Alistipes putredinis]|uniref:hypothetical protein n=1 Tax=Alistipes putredinis TaxID=28117 RepID=UPI003FEFB47E
MCCLCLKTTSIRAKELKVAIALVWVASTSRRLAMLSISRSMSCQSDILSVMLRQFANVRGRSNSNMMG